MRGVSQAAARVIVEEDAAEAEAVVMRDEEGGRACPREAHQRCTAFTLHRQVAPKCTRVGHLAASSKKLIIIH